eukprot:8491345-Ditylum_brightwellii.AAC.1
MFEEGSNKKFNHIIMNNCMDIVLKLHQFIKGVVDSEDLPLNISHEMLQKNKFCCAIKKYLVKKCMEIFKNFLENKDSYRKIYTTFYKNLKLDICKESTNSETITKLMR